MSSFHRVVLMLLLLSGLSGRLVAGQDADKDEPSALPGDENAAVLRRNSMWDVTDEDGSPKVVLLADMRQRGMRFRGLNHRLPVMDEPRWSYNPAVEKRIDRRDTDIDVLRCMIGRVYRPCWGRT
ncbi:pro-MCH [Phyllopteryx taeniolatus]|uniref:pro-MCH n=1 Tax=Phyllopteryx taeniolatus TaxID=161469 RepID=UPI002AD503A5|nr:pro-MCH [Phyllopteryx taeniolatus]